MRPDMSQVLVDEPRHGRAYARAVAGRRRQQRQRLDRLHCDGESAPSRFSMKQGRGDKRFGEHLNPMYRWLRQQVSRPWAKVWSELCATLDRRSVVQAHLFQHIEGRVDVQTLWRDGQVWTQDWRGLVPLAQSWGELYVHPRTGLLLVNRARLVARRQRKQLGQVQRLNSPANRHTEGLPPGTQWHRVAGQWYEVQLRELPADGLPVFDLLLRRLVGPGQVQLLQQHYGSRHMHAFAKRQLDGATLRRHGLFNETDA